MEKLINDIFIHRFLNKETSELENNEILLWVSASEENRTEFKKSHQFYLLSKVKIFQSEINIDMAWNKLNSQLPKTDSNPKIVYLDFFIKIAVENCGQDLFGILTGHGKISPNVFLALLMAPVGHITLMIAVRM